MRWWGVVIAIAVLASGCGAAKAERDLDRAKHQAAKNESAIDQKVYDLGWDECTRIGSAKALAAQLQATDLDPRHLADLFASSMGSTTSHEPLAAGCEAALKGAPKGTFHP